MVVSGRDSCFFKVIPKKRPNRIFGINIIRKNRTEQTIIGRGTSASEREMAATRHPGDNPIITKGF